VLFGGVALPILRDRVILSGFLASAVLAGLVGHSGASKREPPLTKGTDRRKAKSHIVLCEIRKFAECVRFGACRRWDTVAAARKDCSCQLARSWNAWHTGRCPVLLPPWPHGRAHPETESAYSNTTHIPRLTLPRGVWPLRG